MPATITIEGKEIGQSLRPYIIAELSGNHQQDINRAKALITAAAQSGVDAVKLQTYTPDTLTLPVDRPEFYESNALWGGRHLYDMYKEGTTPWEWHPELASFAKNLGLTLFSSPFDESAVDFLEHNLNPPLYKIASDELTHIPLLKYIAKTKKPILLSTGKATMEEIHFALNTLYNNGAPAVVLLKCISAYPAKPIDFNLHSIPAMAKEFNTLVGLSDHSIGNEIALGAVALGACVIEKHIVLDRRDGSLDSGFSTEPHEFAELVKSTHLLHQALGSSTIGPSSQDAARTRFRRSIYVCKDIQANEALTPENLKIIRPASGLPPIEWENVIGKKATCEILAGTPLAFEHIG